MTKPETMPPDSRLRRMIRSGLAVGVCAATLIIGGFLFASAVAHESPRQRTDIGLGRFAAKTLVEYRNTNTRYLFLGDSLSMPNAGGGVPPQNRIAKWMRKNRKHSDFRNLSLPGLTIFSHYFLNEAIGNSGAEKVILGFNMGWFSRPAHHQPLGLEGFLPPDQWLTAMQLPLGSMGLTAADVLSAGVVDQLGLRPARQWTQKVQSNAYVAYNRFVRNFQSSLGASMGMAGARGIRFVSTEMTKSGSRLLPLSAKEILGPILGGLPADEPGLLALGELVKRLHQKGIEILVVAQPINIERLRDIGMVNEALLEASLKRMRETTEANGGDFLDLHEALPDEAFRDHLDHLDFRDASEPSKTLTRPMLAWLLADESPHRPFRRSSLFP